ncbi:NADH-FMN oxidoreductase RutF, flavin reductase (DIM6/NTAB) family [Streptomyces sp. DvalAA-14]|uniref:flavin reductase family protein n=1 Tax=unclassified Streptomyces TaxID=2593676 RepID=UPI00081B02BA|nr:MULTISPECIES: flavin reductase family protein [unclassified Streptomyces]MYS24279.1 flavin reductase [Streptomyces sp. SID4948]SCE44581.1 NADH-FMN oxidoreductase RutF, flavin reductase (DIM6/NTAB) family [Streptomyces sp. DvalAA-14]
MTETLGTDDRTAAFRATMSRLASGVSVITTLAGSTRIGITASAVSALSLDPLQLLVCIGNHLYTRTAIADHGRFAVNVLGHDGEELARNFAGSHADRFAGVETYDDHGVPVLKDAIAAVVCDVSAALPGGDHTIFVGDARFFEHTTEGEPLVYFAGRFGRHAA